MEQQCLICFSFLMNVFPGNKDLISKFRQIAENNNKSDWVNFFSIYNIIYNEKNINYNTDELIKKLLILSNSNDDPILEMLIKKEIYKMKNV